MKIQKKLLLSILVTVVLAFTMTITVVSYNGTLLLKDKAIQLSGEMAQHYGAAIQNTIENKITVVAQMNHVLSSLKKDKIVDREIYNHVLQNMLANNKDILGMWVIYEPNALDGRDKEFIDKPGHDKTGRYIPYFNRGAGEIKLEALTDYDKEGAGDYFLIPKRTKKMSVIEPYVYKVNGEDVLMTSISMPLMENGEVVGVTGIDISLKEYAKFCESIRPFGTGYINLASNSGIYIYSKDGNLIGKNIKDNPNLPQASKEKLLNLVKIGGKMDLVDEEHGYLRAIRPIQIGSLNQPWTISATIPLERVNQETQKLTQTALIAAVISILILSVLLFLLVKTVIQKPLSIVHQLINKISSTGQFYHRATYQSQDEFGELVKNVNQLSASLEQTFKETNQIMAAVAKGDFSHRLELPLSGDLAILKENINFSVAKVDLTMHELSSVMQALKQGDFSKRVSTQIEGEFKHDVDSAMIAIETIIQDINITMSALAVSDFSKRVTGEAQGNLHLLKENINTTIDTIEVAIEEINNVMNSVANGQLNIHVDNQKYQYQFKDLMTSVHYATGSLRNLISQVVDSIRIISTAVREIAAGNTDLASRTAEQAASLEETAASLESVMDTINTNTNKARDANRSVMDSMLVAEQGGKVVHQVMSMMQGISISSKKISEIITIIDNISFQTNILSLNAAVESARAGEAGRGFAVVANEVRTLAQRSASAAKDIATLITETVSQIQNASQRVEAAGGTMESIVKAVKNVTYLMSDITQASIEQSENISQVKIAVDQLNSITQQNAALVEEVSATSESLDHQTHDLELATRVFKI